jgi:hypothetical protein
MNHEVTRLLAAARPEQFRPGTAVPPATREQELAAAFTARSTGSRHERRTRRLAARPPLRRRWRAGWAVAGAGLIAAIAAVTLGIVSTIAPAGTPPGSGARHHAIAITPTGRLAARQILLTAATAAAGRTAKTGAYWRVSSTTVAGGVTYTQQTWTRPDGQTWVLSAKTSNKLMNDPGGRRRRQFPLAGENWMFTQGQSPHVLPAVAHISARMRALLRRGWTFQAVVGSRRWIPISPRQNAALAHGAGQMTFGQLQRLPAGPAELKAWLLGYQRTYTRRTGLPDPEPVTLIQSLIELVALAPAPPQARAAAFRVMATLPDVTSLGPVHGGQGLRISLSAGQHAALVVDPSTSQTRAALTVADGARTVSSVSVNARWVSRLP